MGFSVHKIWQILKCFTGTFRQAQTLKLGVAFFHGCKSRYSGGLYTMLKYDGFDSFLASQSALNFFKKVPFGGNQKLKKIYVICYY